METNIRHTAAFTGMEHSFLAGLEYRDLHNELKMQLDDYWSNILPYEISNEAEIDERIWGFFIQDEIGIHKDLFVHLGIRSVNLSKPAFQLTENLTPEKEESFELGIRGEFSEIVRFSLAGFHTRTKDKIIQTDSRYKYENAGKSRSYGIEMNLGLHFQNSLYTIFDYANQYLLDDYTVVDLKYRYLFKDVFKSKGDLGLSRCQ